MLAERHSVSRFQTRKAVCVVNAFTPRTRVMYRRERASSEADTHTGGEARYVYAHGPRCVCISIWRVSAHGDLSYFAATAVVSRV